MKNETHETQMTLSILSKKRKRRRAHQHNHTVRRQQSKSIRIASSRSVTQRQPKVALLFLTRADHEQPRLWETFLHNHRHQFSVYCHPAFPKHIAPHSFLRRTQQTSSHEGLLPTSECIPKPNTRWAHLTLAYYQLLHHAFHDTNNNNQRFVYVSETCVPIVSANEAYKRLTRHLDATFMDAPHPTSDNDRYYQTILQPSKCAFPHRSAHFRQKTASCATLLARSGVLPTHFFKHSGWFSPNRRDAKRLLHHKDAFEALNMISAGDEHLLSILQRKTYKTTSALMQKRITYVEWDNDKMQQCKALLNKENKAFWDYLDKHPNEHRKYMKKRNVLKDANMHPIQYTTIVPTSLLKKASREGSVLLRKVRRSCSAHNIQLLL